MPRKRKPLATQKGNLTVAQQEDKKLEERLVLTGKETLAKPPTWLIDARAKNEFKRLVKEFEKMEIDVIGNLDVNNLGCYCNAFSYYISVTKQLKKEHKVIKKPTQNGEILVTQEEDGEQKYYKLQEGSLAQLDANKKPVEGEMAPFYVLTKVK